VVFDSLGFMRCPTWVRASEIDDWAKTTAARTLLPELVCRLVYAAVDRPNLKVIDFPAHEEVQRPGYDGTTLTDAEATHVPKGLCFWELGCEANPGGRHRWILLHKALTRSRIDAFELVIVEVLSESDPALDLPAEKRIMAPLLGNCHRYSDALRGGLAQILALSAGMASENPGMDDYDFIRRGRRIVARLLPAGCSWKRWASIGSLLPLLAEAAPEEFLGAIAQDLESGNPELVELMRQEHGDMINGAVYHAGLLWGLETLEWSTKYTAGGRVTRKAHRLGSVSGQQVD
jgi:hypothetical protein